MKLNLNSVKQPPKVHIFFDLDETLISGPNHWKSAAANAIHSLTNHQIYKNSGGISKPEYVHNFLRWNPEESAKLKKELGGLTGKKFTDEQVFLFKVLRDEIYNKNSNDLKQFDKLIKKTNTNIKNIKPLVKVAVDAYHDQTEKNIQSGVLSANKGAVDAIKELLNLGATVSIATKGYDDKQKRKVNEVLFKSENNLRSKIPVFTTEKKLIWIRKVGEKTPAFYQSLKRKIGAKKTDFLVYIGDRHDSDIIPAKKAGFFTIHIPGRRDKEYLDGIKQSDADILASNIPSAMDELKSKLRVGR